MMDALAVFLLGALAPHAAAWRSEGVLPKMGGFEEYVGKFCFDYVPVLEEPEAADNATGADRPAEKPTAGLFSVEVHGRVDPGPHDSRNTVGPPCWGPCETQGNLYLMAFSDEKHHWQQVYAGWQDLSCEEKLHFASTYIVLDALGREPYATNKTVIVRQSIRPRFWYFAFVNCGARMSWPVTYSIHALNIHQGFQSEFGMDMRNSLVLESVFAALFLLATLIACGMIWCCAGDRAGKRHSHPLLRMLRASAASSAIGCGLRAIHHTFFAYNGIGLVSAGVLGTLFACLAKATFTILQFFIATGWSIFSFTPDQQYQRYALIVALVGCIGLSVGCEIHELYFHDRHTSFYLYETWTGYLILSINLGLLALSWYLMCGAYRNESSSRVRSFYRTVSVAGGIYFASLPAICLAASILSPWVRRKYIERAELGSRFLATALLLFVLRPTNVDTLVAARLKNREQPELLKHEMEEISSEDS